mgnify:CR=1 FL=1
MSARARGPGPNVGLLAPAVAAGGLLSGVFLGAHYAPTLDAAHDSIRHLEERVAFGAFLRALHHWTGAFALALAALHGARVFLGGGYKAPRRGLWVVGGLLTLVLLGFAYTGYLLPGDERAFAGLEVMAEVAGSTPGVGDAAGRIVMGGEVVSSATMARVYTVHTVVLPWALVALLALLVSLWRRADEGKARWPGRARRDAGWALVVFTAVAACAAVAPPALGPKLVPGEAAPDARPEWFLLWVNELLHRVDATFLVAAALPGLLVALGLALPWIARGAERAPARRLPELACAGAVVLFLGALTILAAARAPAPAETAATPAVDPDADLDDRAAPVLEKFRCATCHRIDGAESEQDTGPPLWRKATSDRPSFGALYTRPFFRAKVGDPRAFWADTGMYYTPRRLKPTPEELDLMERWFYAAD